jgi:type IV pilus assembly protein PilP
MSRTVTALTAALLAATLLAGCDSDEREVRDWMAEVQRDTKPTVKPLAEPKDFIPYAYGAKQETDPFSPNKLMTELAKADVASADPNKPDLQRPRELLETFPLDTMHMVGTMEKGGASYALVQIDRALYQVKPGQRIGQNFGVVTRVSDAAVNIREVVQDAAGEWVERMATLELQSKETGK